MKKQLLTAAVAAAVALPMIAQAGVYGRNDGVVRYVDDGTDETWDVGIDKMRWGIVGSEDLGNGMKALYHYEWAMSNDGISGSTSENEKTRLAYVGLEGGWGKLVLGRNWVPSYGAVWSKTDTADTFGTGPSQSNLSGNRIGDQIQYYSPNMSGFTVAFAAVMDNNEASGENEDAMDLWEATAEYKNGPLGLGATYRNDQRDTGACGTSCRDADIWGIGGSYAFGDLSIEGNYGNVDPGSGADETDVFGLGATYKMGDTQISGAYQNNDTDNGAEIDSWYIGVRHFLSKETRIFAEYRSVDDDSAADEVDTLAFGLRKDWKL